MRTGVVLLLVLLLGSLLTFSFSHGQENGTSSPGVQPPNVFTSGLKPRPLQGPPGQAAPAKAGAERAVANPGDPSTPTEKPAEALPTNPLAREMGLAAQRGADWLFRMNGVKGRFLHGYLPALKQEMEGDHYLRQVGAAFALGRAARLTHEPRYAARATQAVLALLEETMVDPQARDVRHTVLPSLVVNRLGAAALLVLAINELPHPQADLLAKSEQLCAYIRTQVRSDGTLCCDDGAEAGKNDDFESVTTYPGQALYALMLSQRYRPAKWKTEVVRQAVASYRGWWHKHHSLDFVCWQTAACTEAYLRTRDHAYADFIFEMNDWLCELQYDTIDPRRVLWYGGFRDWADGKAIETSPTIRTALAAESLALACRTAREASDAAHHGHYVEVLERALPFLTRLQYTEANTQHFADWYRPRVAGAFHASLQDGNLRIDYTHHAVSALTLYVEGIGR